MGVINKVALITGAADGIGKALATRLLEKGAKAVSILDVKDEKAQESVTSLNSVFGGEKVIYIHCDVSNNEHMKAAFTKTKELFGGLDIVCNNAGIIDEFNWERCVDINLKGVIRGTYLGVEFMGTKNGGNGGVVINTSSTNGFLPNPLFPVYDATKHGIIGFTRSAAAELMVKENNVRVNALCPALVDTPMRDDMTKGSRYGDQYAQRIASVRQVKMSLLIDTAMKLIEDSGYNGTTCAVVPDDPMLVLEPPVINIK
ncbi:15-hydroxyprostaglandin dehydrogenase [NAD(+)]-like [Saccoglossus kowalevskii]|uniref:15-hydroxyprostaglandin dehydrogenase [NAD(+)] n=1 Tax=Saccoglossus kowalevskii TaxID=10224 RepID=A0ABM0LV09_SACKO|nr:PREDICTED: 15-hydroxyprostaglandin dehydrogenase [NAD(+)]-like [Saccoglossus kowalevskii]